MSVELKQQQIATRALDPNVLQSLAADPQNSVWVSASAGSGKTKVLTDRILRLLLPNTNGQPGSSPHKILALTFTKAAASEMILRLNTVLGCWATLPLEDSHQKTDLKRELFQLLGVPATNQQIESARRLFAQVIDTPGGLKIMTIHSFCQSLLGRFPIEAGLSPNFKVLEDSQRLLKLACDIILEDAAKEKGSPISQAIHNISSQKNNDQFLGLLSNICTERHQFQKILDNNFGTVDGLYTNLCKLLEINAGQSFDEVLQEACSDGVFNNQGLRECCHAMSEAKSDTDKKRGENLQRWLDSNAIQRMKDFPNYQNIFLKKDGEIRDKLITKPVAEAFQQAPDIMLIEAERLYNFQEQANAFQTAEFTRDLFLLGQKVIEKFQELKQKKSVLDFDDLIIRTLDLLSGKTINLNTRDTSSWVRYKLDQGIDHILVDEAQDTNPEQWEIIQLLCDDFFDGETAQEQNKTIFVVGDEKQSIFSFQRARPDKFNEMKLWFQNKIEQAHKNFISIDFVTSFRSVPSVLKLVDTTFSVQEMLSGLGEKPLEHHSYKYKQAGRVELWPVFSGAEKENLDPWAPPVDIIESLSAAAQMADYIGNKIKEWLDNKEELEGYERAIEPDDIMILLRSRTAFVDQLVRALKIRNIPVSGVDRMVLNKQLVIQDLLMCASFSLLPKDDLSLATILKSPFIGYDEDQLFSLSHNRQGSLLQALKSSSDSETIAWIEKLIDHAKKLCPYEFFSKILRESCPASEQSGLHALKKRLGDEVLDPLNEFMTMILRFEQDHTPSLQLFLQEQLTGNTEIKRQMDKVSGVVRIMTVHGAKGLQAPIVILPDTIKTRSSKPDQILWPDRSSAELPFFCPQSKKVPKKCRQAFDVLKQKENDEYRRLLYVALTRAENRLYIGGYKNSDQVSEDSWYAYIQNAFNSIPDVEEIQFSIKEPDKTIYRYTNPSLEDLKIKQEELSLLNSNIQVPKWLFKSAPEEQDSSRFLIPSKSFENFDHTESPLKNMQLNRYKRGNLIHKLLQFLPGIPEEDWEKTIKKFLVQPAHGLEKETQDNIKKEILNILYHPDFSPIFGVGSMAEVPVTGMIKGNVLVSGQIDRLLVADNEVFIVDYKTNRLSPKQEKDIPDIYKKQMQGYAEVIREIYPNKKIRAALLWTDDARLMEVPV